MYEWLRIKGLPEDYPQGGAPIAEFDGSLLDFIEPVKERRGTSTDHLVIADADVRFLEYRFESSATSGDNRGIYNRLYMTGAGGGGESLRSYTDVVGVACGTCHGAHISLGFGESTTGGAITGLGAAVRATLGLPDVAMASGGTYCALQVEIYSFGAASDAGAVTMLSYFRVVNDGHANGIADVDDDAYLFDIVGHTEGAGNMVVASATEANYATAVRCRINGVVKWLMFASASG